MMICNGSGLVRAARGKVDKKRHYLAQSRQVCKARQGVPCRALCLGGIKNEEGYEYRRGLHNH
jgi:hypothetical protein